MDVFSESRCTKILADLRHWTVSWDGVNDWLRDDLMPRLYERGLQCLAVIVPPADVHPEQESNQFAAERFAEQNPNINPAFSSEEEAVDWLISFG